MNPSSKKSLNGLVTKAQGHPGCCFRSCSRGLDSKYLVSATTLFVVSMSLERKKKTDILACCIVSAEFSFKRRNKETIQSLYYIPRTFLTLVLMVISDLLFKWFKHNLREVNKVLVRHIMLQ